MSPFGVILVCIFPHSGWIRRDTPYLSVFSTNAGKSGKNADQKNSGYGVFLRSTNQFVRDTILWSRKNWYLLKRTCPNQFQLSVAVFQCYGTQIIHIQQFRKGCRLFPAGIYLFKVNIGNTRTKCLNLFKVNNKETRATPVWLWASKYWLGCLQFLFLSIFCLSRKKAPCSFIRSRNLYFLQPLDWNKFDSKIRFINILSM